MEKKLLHFSEGTIELRLAKSLEAWHGFVHGYLNHEEWMLKEVHYDGQEVAPVIKSLGLCAWVSRTCFEEEGQNKSLELLTSLLDLEFGVKSDYPFGGHSQYCKDQAEQVMHKNMERVGWAAQKLGYLFYLDFLKTWLRISNEFAINGNIEGHDKRLKEGGLCVVVQFISDNDYEVTRRLHNALARDFPGNSSAPFGGTDIYEQDAEGQTALLNEDRRAWVKKEIERLESSY